MKKLKEILYALSVALAIILLTPVLFLLLFKYWNWIEKIIN